MKKEWQGFGPRRLGWLLAGLCALIFMYVWLSGNGKERERLTAVGTEKERVTAAGMDNGYEADAQMPQEKKKIALTFDDGPHPVYTEQLLDGLLERDVKASFFLLGSSIEGKEGLVRRMAEEGHLIGNHTYSHVDITKLPVQTACSDIQRTSESICNITGQPVEYVRPPFGSWDKELECQVMMLPIFWSVDPLDWTTENVDGIVEKVVTDIEENDIILMHDASASSVEAALRIVDLLQAENYEFVTADQLILE